MPLIYRLKTCFACFIVCIYFCQNSKFDAKDSNTKEYWHSIDIIILPYKKRLLTLYHAIAIDRKLQKASRFSAKLLNQKVKWTLRKKLTQFACFSKGVSKDNYFILELKTGGVIGFTRVSKRETFANEKNIKKFFLSALFTTQVKLVTWTGSKKN